MTPETQTPPKTIRNKSDWNALQPGERVLFDGQEETYRRPIKNQGKEFVRKSGMHIPFRIREYCNGNTMVSDNGLYSIIRDKDDYLQSIKLIERGTK